MYMHSCLCLLAQQNLGIRNSNYAGIQGALLNPSAIADSKLEWDVNVLSGDEVFANTRAFILCESRKKIRDRVHHGGKILCEH
jgi:hypothetical protein